MDIDTLPLVPPWPDLLRNAQGDPTLGPLADQVVAAFAAFNQALSEGHQA